MTAPVALQYGWRCGGCGWQTFDVDVMRSEVNRLNGDGTITLVCPDCRAEGRFVDAERTMACYRPIGVACPTVDLCTDGQACAWPRADDSPTSRMPAKAPTGFAIPENELGGLFRGRCRRRGRG
jgi:hypothetical protein